MLRFNLESNVMNIRNKINEKYKYIQVIQDLGSLAQISSLMHKSNMSKISKNNAIYLDEQLRSWYIYTRCISLVRHNLRKVIIT